MNNTIKYHEDDKNYFWHPWSSNHDNHPIIASGKSCYVFDTNGKKIIDATSAALNASCGLRNRAILKAAYRQMKKLSMFDTKSFSVIPAIELAKNIASLLPKELCKTFFCNSGSEAVETAIKMAISYNAIKGTGKYKIYSFTEGYHGSTVMASLLSGSQFINSNSIEINNILSNVELSKLDISESESTKSLELLLGSEQSKEVAAFICEPILGVGGFIFPHAHIIKKIHDLCKNNNIIFILDETFTSYGRTGKMFAFEHYGVVPDILITGKGISNAIFPLSTITATNTIYNEFSNEPLLKGFRNGHTNSGHASACWTGLKTIEYIVKHKLVDNSASIGEFIRAALVAISQKYSFVSNVRGLGLLIAFDVPNETVAKELFDACYENGLIIRANGKAIGIIPPLNIKMSHAKEIIKKLSISLANINKNIEGVK